MARLLSQLQQLPD